MPHLNLEHKDFKVINHITDGGASKIYKINYNNEICILKISKDQNYINQVQIDNEIEIHQLISHSHIPTLKETLVIDERKAIILSFIKGNNLAHLIENKKVKFNNEETKKIILNLANIIKDFHRVKPSIILRDIKPSNIIINEMLEVFIVDFGISTNGMTKTANKAFGTRGFTAPEAHNNGVYGITSDIYSIGATYQFIETIENLKSTRIIDKCMKQDEHERYQTIDELLIDLEYENKISLFIKKIKSIFFKRS